MLDNDDTNDTTSNTTGNTSGSTTADNAPPAAESPDAGAPPTDAPVKKAAAKKTAAKKSAAPAKKAAAKKTTKKAAKTAPAPDGDTAPPAAEVAVDAPGEAPVKPKKKSAARKKAAAPEPEAAPSEEGTDAPAAPMVLFQAPETTAAAPRKRAARKTAPAATEAEERSGEGSDQADRSEQPDDTEGPRRQGAKKAQKTTRKRAEKQRPADADEPAAHDRVDSEDPDDSEDSEDSEDSGDGEGGARRRRRRGGRRRRRPADGSGEGDDADDSDEDSGDTQDTAAAEGGEGSEDAEGSSASRRRRRRRRTGDDSGGSGGSGASGGSGDDSGHGSSRARKPRNPEDEITSIGGSTRLEAKKQRRREGREAGRRRAPIVSEAEFLARRESVDRVMVIRQHEDLTQIGVIEDKVLVEHYVARESQTSLIGNVYLGRVQNVLPSMEAAFIDIGKGRNAVLYAGEVNWAAVGHKEGQPRKIESVLSSGQTVLVQVSKDPIGHKGARLTGQVSLPGRFLVYVPEGNTSGISRKLPDTERNRLKTLLKEIVPETAGVIVRTAAEGASEEELTRDVERLTARWNDIEEKIKAGKSPQLLYGEPDLTLKVVRDLFTEDFAKLVVQGDDAWDLVENYVSHVAPDLQDRLERFDPGESNKDLFATYRIDEQIAKGLDRKVWLPSGGSLIIDRTEAMTVVDVNTGKFTGSGGNLEETVTKNNLEAAEEIVRQLRLRDIGGIIVVDFIDMVLESNRDLVLRRLVECLGRDRTRHQVAEVTSLGLVQMTRKRIGTGLLEAFSHECEHCKGRGVVIEDHPVEAGSRPEDADEPRGRRSRGGRNRGRSGTGNGDTGSGGNGGNAGQGDNGGGGHATPSPADLARSRPPEKSADDEVQPDQQPDQQPEQEPVEQVDEQVDEQGPEKSVLGTPSTVPPEPQVVPSSTSAEAEPAESTGSTGSTEQQGDAARVETSPEPRVVTSTRRRTARRPAGPPVATSTASVEPVAVPVEPASAGYAPEPSVEESTHEVDGVDDGVDDGMEENGDGEGGFSLVHVPIKRKGSRKR